VMQFRPCIDLHKGKVKQIVGSTLSDGTQSLRTNFETDRPAADFARMYQQDGLIGGHVIALGEGNEEACISAVSAYPGGLQVGGGITPETALKYLQAGASHVIITSYIFTNGALDFSKLQKMVDTVGKKRLVLDLSCRKRQNRYYVVVDRWQKFTDFEVSEENLHRLANQCDEFLVHGVDVEGMQLGIQEDLVQLLGSWCSIPVTYAGGIRSIEDLELVKRLGRGRVDATIGSALDIFGGSLSYKQVVSWHKQQQQQRK